MWGSVTKSSGGADGAQRTDSRAVSQPNKRKKYVSSAEHMLLLFHFLI